MAPFFNIGAIRMKKFTVLARPFMAAKLFAAKNDVRWYLNGVMIERENIVATNGHAMFVNHSDCEMHGNDQGYIINVIGTIPRKSYKINFELDEEKKSGVAFFECEYGSILGCLYFKLLEGKYPNWSKVIKRDLTAPTSEIGVNATYLSILDKAVKLVGNAKYCGVHLKLHGPDNHLIFDIKSPEYDSTVVIMPIRL
jgi:hypothetical protein